MGNDSLGSLVAMLAADITGLKQGLLDGKGELAGFKTVVSETASQVKDLLKFAGLSLGFYELISQAKEFGKSILEEGGKTEVLRGAADSIAKYYGMSSAAVDVYIEKLKEKNIEESRALEAVNAFMRAGLSIDQLPQLAAASQDFARSMGMSAQEAFSTMVTGIVKATPKQLALMAPELKQALKAMLSDTNKDVDAMIVSGPEKAQMMLDLVLQSWQKAKGAGDATVNSYQAKMEEYRLKVAQVKEGLFELVKPIGMAITQQEIKSWDDFYSAVGKNKAVLKELGENIADYVTRIGGWVRSIASFAGEHKDLIGYLVEIKLLVTAMKWTGIAAGVEAVSAVLVKLGLLSAALAGPWPLLIVATIVGAGAVMDWAASLSKTHPEYVGGAEWVPSEEYKAGGLAAGRKERYKPATAGTPSPFGGFIGEKPVISDAEAKRMAEETRKKALKDAALGPKPAKGGKGGGAGAEEDLLGEHMKTLEAQRKADLAAAADQIQLLKATLDQKRALLAQDLAARKIDGAEYYQKLQELEKQETAAALAEIAKKRAAQKAAYADELTVLAQQQAKGKFSPEMGAEKTAALAAKNRQEMAKLDLDAAKLKLDGEKKITDELTKQIELRKQYTQKTEDLNVDTAQLLGAISSQEATLQKLVLDWKRTKDAVLATPGGASPEQQAYLTAGEKNLEAKKADALYDGYATQITQGISSLTDALMSGGQDLMKATNTMFKGLFTAALKPGLEQLQHQLVKGFKDLFGAAGGGIASGLMGAIGIVGMLLTSSSSKSSFSASGVQSGVTSHELMRGIIAGDTSLPIAQIGASLQDSMVPVVGRLDLILAQLKLNTPGQSGNALGLTVNASGLVPRVKQAIQDVMEQYFEGVQMLGPAKTT